MRFELLNRTEYKGVESVYTKHLGDLLRNDRHGIHIVFMQSGSFGRFDVRTTLLTIVACIGINACISLVLDVIAAYIIPSKVVNETLMRVRTGDIMNMSKKQCEELVERLKKHDDEMYNIMSTDKHTDDSEPLQKEEK